MSEEEKNEETKLEGGEGKETRDADKKPEGGDGTPKDEKKTAKEDGGKVKFGDDNKTEDYELKLPKDSHLNESDQKRITEYAKKQGLGKEAAQELLDAENDSRKVFLDEALRERDKQIEGWVDESKKDAEIGGDNFSKSVELAKRVVERFGTKDFMAVLDDSGYGSHKEVLRLLSRIGKAMDDDSFVAGKKEKGEEKSLAEKLYGGTKS